MHSLAHYLNTHTRIYARDSIRRMRGEETHQPFHPGATTATNFYKPARARIMRASRVRWKLFCNPTQPLPIIRAQCTREFFRRANVRAAWRRYSRKFNSTGSRWKLEERWGEDGQRFAVIDAFDVLPRTCAKKFWGYAEELGLVGVQTRWSFTECVILSTFLGRQILLRYLLFDFA